MKTVFCIGNGQSRAPIDLIKLRPHGKIYGCNGLSGISNLKKQIIEGVSESLIRESWKDGLDKFKKIREKYLLY